MMRLNTHKTWFQAMLIIIFGTTLKLGGIVQGLMYHPKWYEMGVRYWFANWLIL